MDVDNRPWFSGLIGVNERSEFYTTHLTGEPNASVEGAVEEIVMYLQDNRLNPALSSQKVFIFRKKPGLWRTLQDAIDRTTVVAVSGQKPPGASEIVYPV